ncbi:hypothetical protein F4809DRAFT_278352 [Biscogniauxia mediterranea]|nr:hypothetical protein F4809DRAFT_278352 [Biscogniauxia mediterranea]
MTPILPLIMEHMPVRAAPNRQVPAAPKDHVDASENDVDADDVEDASAGSKRQAPAPQVMPPEVTQGDYQHHQQVSQVHNHAPRQLHEAPHEEPQPSPEISFESPADLGPMQLPEFSNEAAIDFDFNFDEFQNYDLSLGNPQPAVPGASNEVINEESGFQIADYPTMAHSEAPVASPNSTVGQNGSLVNQAARAQDEEVVDNESSFNNGNNSEPLFSQHLFHDVGLGAEGGESEPLSLENANYNIQDGFLVSSSEDEYDDDFIN